jgi:hypothetical protein
MEVDKKPMTPRFSGLAAVQMGFSLDFVAVLAEVSRGAVSSFACSDGQPVMTKVDTNVRMLSSVSPALADL